jgi:hypothetical protein
MAEITLEKKTKIHGDLGNHLGKIIGLANARLSSAAAAGWSIGELCPYKLRANHHLSFSRWNKLWQQDDYSSLQHESRIGLPSVLFCPLK